MKLPHPSQGDQRGQEFAPAKFPRARGGFTLIEIMIVVALIGLISTIAIPNIYQLAKKTGMRRAISDLREVCDSARRRAIFSGKEVSVMFYPTQRTFCVSPGAATAPTADSATTESQPDPEGISGNDITGIIPEDVTLELLEVNLDKGFESGSEWTYSWVRVRFFPNGTSDEMTIIFRSERNELRKLTLEPTTALLTQTTIER